MFFKKSKNYTICLEQPIRNIVELEDGVFSKKMVGDGFFFESSDKILTIKAFEKCKVTMIAPTKHAIGLQMQDIEVMIHYGLDTIAEKGTGIECSLKKGQMVNKGDVLLEIDNNYYQENSYQTPVIYVFPNLEELEYNLKITDEQKGIVEFNL